MKRAIRGGGVEFSQMNMSLPNDGDEYSQYYISAADYVITQPMVELPEGVLAKLHDSRKFLASSYNIPSGKYTKVYTTSDIHADIYAISRILFRAGLTTEDLEADLSNLYTIRWNPAMNHTLLVIVGDIVDGYREGLSVNDPVGDIEIKLHILLYNLRVSAQSYNSELRFTIGNHDYHTVIQDINYAKDMNLPEPYNTATDPSEIAIIRKSYYGVIDVIYNDYVHPTAKALFGTRANRRNCLLPFYECCPYACITVDNEMIFVHASLHGGPQGQYNLTQKLLEVQEHIDNSGLVATIIGDNLSNIHFIAHVNTNMTYGGPLWTRFYSKSSQAVVCSVVAASPYKMTIVGHCQTNSCGIAPGNMNSILSKAEYRAHSCDILGGCVLLGCDDPADAGPRLAFVDIAMSRAFSNKGRREEILLLENIEGLQDTRFYNKISRINTIDSTLIDVWQSPARGGRRNKKTHKKRKTLRKCGKKSTARYRS
jgi:hypothetical protein